MSSNVVNLDSGDWTPSQLARWFSSVADKDQVARAYIVIEYKNDFVQHTWSKCTCEELWYMISWSWSKLQKRYFDGERETT